ncbi:MAG: hypothetical protein HC921_05220 [Synechococcaceae cyanobacterium SM2_3_1]|nr:hypothetical protein [Synechococcaceae cyanobacterium SM2_3_1]
MPTSESAHPMAAALIFEADLDLCSAQMARLTAWLREEYADLYPQVLNLMEASRKEFERRVHIG